MSRFKNYFIEKEGKEVEVSKVITDKERDLIDKYVRCKMCIQFSIEEICNLDIKDFEFYQKIYLEEAIVSIMKEDWGEKEMKKYFEKYWCY